MRRMQVWRLGTALAGLPLALMSTVGTGLTLGAGLVLAQPVAAQVDPVLADQSQVWIQIEAKNARPRIEERLRYWAETLPNVSGFVMASGWYAAALGPYDRAEAEAMLEELKLLRAIPADSFIADARVYRAALDPVSAAPAVPPAPISGALGAPTSAVEVAPIGVEPVAPLRVEPVETLAEARRAEAALSREERMEIQRALQWAGALAGSVDGAFGRGTRAAISAWQAGAGVEPTGVLTSSQTRMLLESWRAEITALGLERVRDEEAGIELDLPLALVGFERYAPPFARYTPKGDSGLEIRLISQPGDAQALAALYAQLETSGLIPAEGPRGLRGAGFDLSGFGAETEGHAWAELSQGVIKGYVLTARKADAARNARVLQLLQMNFRSLPGQVLDPGLVPLDDSAKAAMLTGIEKKRPKRAGSGVFATPTGLVATAASVVESCGRLTLDGGIAARVVAADAAAGVALLQPEAAMTPKGVAEFATSLPREGSEVMVAGYSFGADLGLPAMTFGRFEAPSTLEGTLDRARLSLPSLPGDVGGAVLSQSGQVVGILQAPPQDPARALPQTVAYLAPVAMIAAVPSMASAGLKLAPDAARQLPPEDLSRLGSEMAVQVLCWD